MTNKQFYEFCKLRRNNQGDMSKEVVLQDIWKYMWECGVTKQGVKDYIEHQITQCQGNQKRIDAYRWLLEMFDGPFPTNKSQPTLF